MKDPIVQEHEFGCGAACVAFVVGKKYKSIAESLGSHQAQTKGFMCGELKAELSKHGLDYVVKYVRPAMQEQLYQEGAIVFVKRSKQYPGGHFLTYHKGSWADSWINFPLDNSLRNAKAGFRKHLPGQAQYALLPLK